MILYAVEYNGALTNYEWSIVTIWKEQSSAQKEMDKYISNWPQHSQPDYRIIEIDTDKENCVYDCDHE